MAASTAEPIFVPNSADTGAEPSCKRKRAIEDGMEETPYVAPAAEAGTTGGGANQEDGPHLSPLHGLGLWGSEVKEYKKIR